MSKLELVLLGRFECLLSSGKQVTLAMRKAEVLLAFLALSPGLRHPRERLINLLWSDRGEQQARNSLRQCLSAIRKSLGEAADLALQIDRTTVCLNAEVIEVDVHEFERLAAAGEYESLVTAADLYRGEFLEGIAIRDAACQEWLDSERGRFKRQFIEILHNLAETQLVSHDYGNAIRSAERLVEQDPLAEAGWRLLMQAYAAKGDRSHALQAFKRCQQVLHRELEVEPEQATVDLRDRIAGGGAQLPADMPAPSARSSASAAAGGEHSIAVLPFDNLSGDPEQEYFSDGITDSIIMNLALFPDLIVKSRNSSFAFKEQIKSLGEISRELGVDYLVEGSVRRSAGRIRVNVQLIDAASGNQVWGQRYDSDLDDLFELEENLSRSIAATVTGRIESELQRIAIAKGAADQQAYDLLLAGMYHVSRYNCADNDTAIEMFERCLALDPDNVRAHVGLYICYSMGYLGRWIENRKNAFDKAREYIRRATQLDPEDRAAQVFLAEMLSFSGKLDEARRQIDKVLTVNPSDTDALAVLATIHSFLCDGESALKTAEHALKLDPFHPWAEWELAVGRYYCDDYEGTVDALSTMRAAPGFINLYKVAALVRLERIDEARTALKEFMRECESGMKEIPRDIDEWIAYTRENYPFVDAQRNRDLVDTMVQAGLEEMLPGKGVQADAASLPSILVLPFTNLSGDPEQEYFSDGITSSLILGLGMFRGLRVKSQNSSFAYRDSNRPSIDIAAELGVDFLIEGSMRKSGSKIRLAVQLVDAESDTQIWGKQYDAELEDILELEQQLSGAIAGTISGRIGHTLQKSASHKSAKNLRSYDYLLRGLYHFGRFTARDLATAREMIEKCLEIDPENATAHTNLGIIHVVELMENWSANRRHSEECAHRHLGLALEFDPENALAHAYMSEYMMIIRRDFDQSEFHADKAIECNPTASEGYVAKADLLALSRRVDEAVPHADKGLQLDPHSVGAGWAAGGVYREAGDYQKSIKALRSINHPPASVHALIAVCLLQLELTEEAHQEMALYRQMARQEMPSYPDSQDQWRAFWRTNIPYRYDEDFNRFFDLLLEAGLLDEAEEAREAVPSIAVLPFDNMSSDPEQEYFADGITADIVDTLAKFKHLRTVSRYSTLAYKNPRPPIADIAAQQGVRYILEGSVRKSGERIRVNAELIDSRDEKILWSERFDRDLDDLFAVQDEITRSIALAMKVQLDDGDMARYRSESASDIKAWELTMAAVDLQDTYIRKNLVDARAMVNRAVQIDPGYVYAWISLAWTHWQEIYSGWHASFEDSLAAAEEALARARELDPEYPEIFSLTGCIHMMRHEPEQAIRNNLRAVELEPGNAEIQALAAFAHVFAGDYERGRQYDQTVRRLCPIRANWHYLIEAQIEAACGNLARAADLYRAGLEVEPESPLCRFFLVDLMQRKGDADAARAYAEEIRALDKAATGRGLVLTYSADPAQREMFHASLARYDLV
jgi:TolB-like protein/DNA-binding SARP family transcriptional activator